MLSKNLSDNIQHIRKAMGDSSDLRVRALTISWARIGGLSAALIYLDGMCDAISIQDSVIPALLEYEPVSPPPPPASLLEWMTSRVMATGSLSLHAERESALFALLSGNALLLIDGGREALAIAISGYEDRGISEAKNQAVTRGPQEAFTETLQKNVTLIRRRIKDSRIRVVQMVKGSITRTTVCIVYLEGIAKQEVVDELRKRMDAFDLEGIFDSHYFEEFFQHRFTLYPISYNTERPDTISAMILEGRVAIIVDGSPYVVAVPAVLTDFIQSAEDYYQPAFFGVLIRTLRILAFFIASYAPAAYIAVTTFHQELLPMQLLLSLAAQREGIPFPAFIEALIMEVTFEILREAGIVSAAMVIIVAITAISSFALPSYSFTLVVRLQRFGFMLLSATMGLYGMYFGMIILVLVLCSIESFGVPYLRPFSPLNAKEQNDAVYRRPFLRWNKKPSGGRTGR